ncbi:serine hydrolase domain-containing protein [Streptomyces stramineus]
MARFGAAGVADLGTGRRMRPTDRFRAGSLTKTVVATVVLQLVAEHRLGLDDPAAAHLPTATAALLSGPSEPDKSGHIPRSAVTVRQLLAHTSGLFSYTDDARFFRTFFGQGFAAHRFTSHQADTLVRTALTHPSYAPPGAAYRYSNTDYLLLGMVIRQVTGHSYAAEARRRVITPLRLTGTSFPGTRSTLPTPHGRAYSGAADVTDLDPSAAGAAGEMVTTLPDLNRFLAALLSGALLPASGLRAIQDTTASQGRYGLGLYPVRLPCRRTLWGHNGRMKGSYAHALGTAGGARCSAIASTATPLSTRQPKSGF